MLYSAVLCYVMVDHAAQKMNSVTSLLPMFLGTLGNLWICACTRVHAHTHNGGFFNIKAVMGDCSYSKVLQFVLLTVSVSQAESWGMIFKGFHSSQIICKMKPCSLISTKNCDAWKFFLGRQEFAEKVSPFFPIADIFCGRSLSCSLFIGNLCGLRFSGRLLKNRLLGLFHHKFASLLWNVVWRRDAPRSALNPHPRFYMGSYFSWFQNSS